MEDPTREQIDAEAMRLHRAWTCLSDDEESLWATVPEERRSRWRQAAVASLKRPAKAHVCHGTGLRVKAALAAVWAVLRKDQQAQCITWDSSRADDPETPPRNFTNILSATLGNYRRAVEDAKQRAAWWHVVAALRASAGQRDDEPAFEEYRKDPDAWQAKAEGRGCICHETTMFKLECPVHGTAPHHKEE